MKIKALKSFCGTVTMCPKDAPREVSDKLAKELIAAGYAEEVKPEKSEKIPEKSEEVSENAEPADENKEEKSAGKRAKK